MSSLHSETAAAVRAHLGNWGFSSGTQERIGAFGVVWTVFESRLEPLVWHLRNEHVAGMRPSTDKEPASKWVEQLSASAPCFEREIESILQDAASTAADLMAYRHALFHGWLLPFKGGPMFVRNPSWNHEVRNRPSNTAHIDENLLDLALASAWTLCRFTEALMVLVDDPASSEALKAMSQELRSARSDANELRHLADLMSHAKY